MHVRAILQYHFPNHNKRHKPINKASLYIFS